MSIFDQTDLPVSVLDLRQLSPIEDIALAILRTELPDIPCHATIEESPHIPFILVRRMSGMGNWGGDQRGFYDTARLAVHVYASDPDGDMKAAIISDAVRRVLFQAWQNHFKVPGLGTVVKLKLTSEPSRTSDWATSSGPVQYADLPTGGWRYEAHYTMRIRPPRR